MTDDIRPAPQEAARTALDEAETDAPEEARQFLGMRETWWLDGARWALARWRADAARAVVALLGVETDDASDPEAFCQRCRGPNVRTWHAPSPLWNAVMRDPATGHDRYEIVCPACFAHLVEEAGFRPIWCFRPANIDVASLWQDPDGRTWDPDQCLWINGLYT